MEHQHADGRVFKVRGVREILDCLGDGSTLTKGVDAEYYNDHDHRGTQSDSPLPGKVHSSDPSHADPGVVLRRRYVRGLTASKWL